MKVYTKNEYSQLKSIILGRPEGANWPTGDIFFDRMLTLSTYHRPLTKGKVPENIIDEARVDMLHMKDKLEDENIKVFRPEITDWSKYTSDYNYTVNGMHCYSARDLLLSIGDMVIECPTPYVSRQHELCAYDVIKQEAMKDGCRWIAAPRARMENKECVVVTSKMKLTERYPIFDAANILKFNDKLLYLKSATGNELGAKWLQSVVGSEFEVITWDDVYAYAHIDSTLLPISKDTILVNANRVKEDQLPDFIKSYKKIWVSDVAERTFHKFPYASKWIGMNVLSINPETIMVDPIQTNLIDQLKKEKFKVIPVGLRHSRTLGGGHHCVTCDLEREC